MSLRDTNVSKLDDGEFDVLIVGGGINGAVSAASLAARGVKVALIERGDFAGEVSSHSSNLAWGGIKYLESFEFLLVRKLCKCRNQLLREYPSTVREIRFLTTIQKGFRFPPVLLYLGTLLYWVIGLFGTRPPRYLSRQQLARRDAAINTDNAVGGFEYSDCYLHDNDARFVFNFIRSSINYGCIAANYVESLGAERRGDHWHTRARDVVTGREFSLRSRVLINACGPWVDELNRHSGQTTAYQHLFSKGIHLLVDRVTTHHRVLTFFASDGRLFFVIPMGPRTCVGTTDTRVEDPHTGVTDEDRRFVLDNVSQLLNLPKPLRVEDIIAERCAVRPLATRRSTDAGDDVEWVQLSRKHKIEVDREQQHLSIFGGKLTDCLNVGDEIAEAVRDLHIPIPQFDRKWYGEPPRAVREEFFYQAHLMNLDSLTPQSSTEPLSARLWRRYGDRAFDMLEAIRQDPSQAELFIEHTEYLRCEIEEAAESEMIVKLEDFLRRRSKISLVVRHQDIVSAKGLKDACGVLFGQDAEARYREYVETHAASAHARLKLA
ncbi:MAG: glycerol-3-phosphate dehydrogenase/oxidase [Halieaceae bacterium]|jgi:alpha-glycerophosphate oxidase/glycerol-3-phosphate dehydrogenase|nr:glycerol-3-phosphate dehydrogenase/oxidase [Halieaceae bacterium]